MGNGRHRRRGDASRRRRLHPEALGERTAARGVAHPGRIRSCASPLATARGRERVAAPGRAATLVAESPAMQPVLQVLARVGPSDAHVLITGENGTGKSMLARALHDASPRAQRSVRRRQYRRAFRDPDRQRAVRPRTWRLHRCAHRSAWAASRSPTAARCSWTRSATCRVGLRRELLRVLRPASSSASARRARAASTYACMSASNADLQAEVEEGRFRRDLLFRLNTVAVRMPPLRERREDIPLLADALPRSSCPPLSQADRRLRAAGPAGHAGTFLARQHPRTRSRRRARRPHDRRARITAAPSRSSRRVTAGRGSTT